MHLFLPLPTLSMCFPRFYLYSHRGDIYSVSVQDPGHFFLASLSFNSLVYVFVGAAKNCAFSIASLCSVSSRPSAWGVRSVVCFLEWILRRFISHAESMLLLLCTFHSTLMNLYIFLIFTCLPKATSSLSVFYLSVLYPSWVDLEVFYMVNFCSNCQPCNWVFPASGLVVSTLASHASGLGSIPDTGMTPRWVVRLCKIHILSMNYWFMWI